MGRNSRTSRQGGRIPEEAVVRAWLNQLAKGGEFTTLSGDHIRVTDPGHMNPHDGPDFLHAEIQRNGRQERGAIEIHSQTGDWKRHRHENHDTYRKVILHVAMRNDGAHGVALPPTIILSNEREHQYDRESGLPCGSQPSDSPASVVAAALILAAAERFRELCERFEQDEDRHPEDDPTDRLWRGLLRCLGFGGNVSFWEHLTESHTAQEWKALAGMSDRDRAMQMTQWLGERGCDKRSKGVRPGNRPEERRRWLLVILPRILRPGFINQLRDAIRNGTMKGLEGSQEFLGGQETGLGPTRRQEMVINVIAPWAWTLGKREGDRSLQAGAAALFFRYGKDPGYAVLRKWRQLPGIFSQGQAAWPSQAMLWMERRLCGRRKCSECLVDALRNE